jgi:enoyl-CoA hydratase/carnithine racemase
MQYFSYWRHTAADAGLEIDWLDEQGALILKKSRPGFDEAGIAATAAILRRAAADNEDAIKFLVFDFAHAGAAPTRAPNGFADLVAATADLIVGAPIITLAWARGLMNGLDLDFAMSCSALVAEQAASFSFAGDPFDLLGLYAALGRRIGFARAERLIESDRLLSAQEARDLFLVRDVAPVGQGQEGVAAYLVQFERRYNASQAIFRAQRMAEPPIDRRPVLFR